MAHQVPLQTGIPSGASEQKRQVDIDYGELRRAAIRADGSTQISTTS